jgi:hypothetical protein
MSKPLFSIRIDDQNPKHTRLTVFNRGANAGTLIINTDDLDELQKRLSGATVISQSVGTIGPGANVTGVKIDRIGREWYRPSGLAEYEAGDEDTD